MSDNPISLSHLMYENRRYPPPDFFRRKALLNKEQDYRELYEASIKDPDAFWLEQASQLQWMKKPGQALKWRWDSSNNIIEHTWFADGKLNVTYNCLDRHINEGRGAKIAFIWQGEKDEASKSYTYTELLDEVCRCANALQILGIERGDRVCLYMPLIPQLAVAMLACARIGAIHSVVFGGFSAESLAHRIDDSGCKLLITADGGWRAGKEIPLKNIAYEALLRCQNPPANVIVVRHSGTPCRTEAGRDTDYENLVSRQPNSCPCVAMDSEDPLFILYTSGSTGKPKGVVHSQAGYLLYTMLTHRYIFDLHDDDIYWCTADMGWITGHSYVIYGPLANAATIFLYEGVPTYPSIARFWKLIEKYKITIFYTAPTALRTLLRYGEGPPRSCDLSSLRLLGSVGEPINPEAWMWYHQVIGKGRCPLVDTWWQTETGGILISALPGVHTLKPGSAGRPFFGVEPCVLRDDGTPCDADEGGLLCISKPWPAIMRTMWGDHQRFIDTYFKRFDNKYFTGDGCRCDDDGDYWLMGRIDDVVNVSGHRLGTAEVESALVSHEAVAEAAVVPIPHEIKGQGLFAYVILVEGESESEQLIYTLQQHVREEIGPIAIPEKIIIVPALPKTRSGKIMRRILRKIAEKDYENLGDTSTLADPSLVQQLMQREE